MFACIQWAWQSIKCLKTVAGLVTSECQIAEEFGNTWSNNSADCNFSRNYVDQKQSYVNSTYQSNSLCNAAKQLEQKFSLLEMKLAIRTSKGKCPGYDRISYAVLFLRKRSLKFSTSLLSLVPTHTSGNQPQ